MIGQTSHFGCLCLITISSTNYSYTAICGSGLQGCWEEFFGAYCEHEVRSDHDSYAVVLTLHCQSCCHVVEQESPVIMIHNCLV